MGLHIIYGIAHTPKWCSLCNDFGSLLVLCVGCRVAICVKTHETLNGCLEWDLCLEEPDFVYYCPYCARASESLSPVCMVWPTSQPAWLTCASSVSPTREACGRRGMSYSDMTHPS